MFSEAKVTEIYCMADDFAKNLPRYKKNTWLTTRIVSIGTSPTG